MKDCHVTTVAQGCDLRSSQRKAILIPIEHRWANLIYQGLKGIEWRRSFCLGSTGLQLYFYEVSPVQMVTGMATISGIDHDRNSEWLWTFYGEKSQMKRREWEEYIAGAKHLWAIALERPIQFKFPFLLQNIGIRHTPQSWMYLKSEALDKIQRFAGDRGQWLGDGKK